MPQHETRKSPRRERNNSEARRENAPPLRVRNPPVSPGRGPALVGAEGCPGTVELVPPKARRDVRHNSCSERRSFGGGGVPETQPRGTSVCPTDVPTERCFRGCEPEALHSPVWLGGCVCLGAWAPGDGTPPGGLRRLQGRPLCPLVRLPRLRDRGRGVGCEGGWGGG